MKHLFVALIALAMGGALHAQPINRVLAVDKGSFITETNAVEVRSYPKTLNNIHIRAVRHFRQSYKHIENETWFSMPDGYRARFVENGVKCEVTYDKNGLWVYTIRKYTEDKLAKDVRAQVKTVYYDYSIVLVEEIIRPLKPLVHVIHLEDAQSFRNIQICERDMATMLDIKKV